jgi:replicative DNA helicase
MIPHSVEAEQSVLGSLLLDNALFDDIAERLSAEDFYRADHRTIWQACAELRKQTVPFDAVTLAEHFQRNGIETVGLAYLATITRDTPTTTNALAYAKIVRERSISRGAQRIAEELRTAVADSDPEAVDKAIRALMALETVGRDWEHSAHDMMSAAIDHLDTINQAGTHIIGVRSGLRDLDDRLGGFHDGDLIVIGARPAVGKTALLLNMAVSCEVPAGVISAEQPSEQLAFRIIGREGKVSVHNMRRGKLSSDDWQRVAAGTGVGAKLPLWTNDKPGMTIGELGRQARKWKHQRGIKALYVDYLQRIGADDKRLPIRERTIEVTRDLKSLARELNIPVIALAQVVRAVDQREDKRPHMSDLQESGAIEQEADQIIMLYRADAYDITNDPHCPPGTAELNIEKNRHGPTGRIPVSWQAEFMRFGDLTREVETGQQVSRRFG